MIRLRATVSEGSVITAVATGLAADIGKLDNFSFVPAAARAGGVGDSFFVTDVDVNNAGLATATYQALWLPRDTDNSSPIASDAVSVDSGRTKRWADVLGTVFAVKDARRPSVLDNMTSDPTTVLLQ